MLFLLLLYLWLLDNLEIVVFQSIYWVCISLQFQFLSQQQKGLGTIDLDKQFLHFKQKVLHSLIAKPIFPLSLCPKLVHKVICVSKISRIAALETQHVFPHKQMTYFNRQNMQKSVNRSSQMLEDGEFQHNPSGVLYSGFYSLFYRDMGFILEVGCCVALLLSVRTFNHNY